MDSCNDVLSVGQVVLLGARCQLPGSFKALYLADRSGDAAYFWSRGPLRKFLLTNVSILSPSFCQRTVKQHYLLRKKQDQGVIIHVAIKAIFVQFFVTEELEKIYQICKDPELQVQSKLSFCH